LPAKQYLWELPAGRLDPGETPLKAAKRELIEETGYRAKKWQKLAVFYASPGFLAEKMTIYLATQLTLGERKLMEDERISMRWFKADELDKAIEAGKILDAKTQIGFLKWKRYVKR
jgi:ADP-ribose pyrophosphatase